MSLIKKKPEKNRQLRRALDVNAYLRRNVEGYNEEYIYIDKRSKYNMYAILVSDGKLLQFEIPTYTDELQKMIPQFEDFFKTLVWESKFYHELYGCDEMPQFENINFWTLGNKRFEEGFDYSVKVRHYIPSCGFRRGTKRDAVSLEDLLEKLAK